MRDRIRNALLVLAGIGGAGLMTLVGFGVLESGLWPALIPWMLGSGGFTAVMLLGAVVLPDTKHPKRLHLSFSEDKLPDPFEVGLNGGYVRLLVRNDSSETARVRAHVRNVHQVGTDSPLSTANLTNAYLRWIAPDDSRVLEAEIHAGETWPVEVMTERAFAASFMLNTGEVPVPSDEYEIDLVIGGKSVTMGIHVQECGYVPKVSVRGGRHR